MMGTTHYSHSDIDEEPSWISVAENELDVDATNAGKSKFKPPSATAMARSWGKKTVMDDPVEDEQKSRTMVVGPAREEVGFHVLTIRMSEEALLRAGPRFFQLPRTLRDRIYALVLVEPPRWNKRHRGVCRLRDRVGHAEKTPFHPDQCTCFKRTGLGLLGVSKRIHDETVPVLYGTNTWCYKTAVELVNHIRVLRAEYTRKIQHVSIMGLQGSEGIIRWMEFLPSYKPVWYGSDDGVWNALMHFRALRSLELLHAYFPTKHKEFGMLVDTLPDLERVTMVVLNCDDHLAYGYGGGKRSYFMHKAELEVPLHSTSRKNTINQLVAGMSDLSSGLKYRLLHAWQQRLWVNEPWMSSVPGEWKYDDEHEHATLVLSEKAVRVRLYGQPNSVATRKWIMKEEWRAAIAERAMGWPTRAQEIAEQVKVRQRKEESEGEREKEQMLSHASLLESRAIANRERDKRERNDRIKEQEIARNERKDERERQQEEMKKERKRFYRQTNRIAGRKDESLSEENDAEL